MTKKQTTATVAATSGGLGFRELRGINREGAGAEELERPSISRSIGWQIGPECLTLWAGPQLNWRPSPGPISENRVPSPGAWLRSPLGQCPPANGRGVEDGGTGTGRPVSNQQQERSRGASYGLVLVYAAATSGRAMIASLFLSADD